MNPFGLRIVVGLWILVGLGLWILVGLGLRDTDFGISRDSDDWDTFVSRIRDSVDSVDLTSRVSVACFNFFWLLPLVFLSSWKGMEALVVEVLIHN